MKILVDAFGGDNAPVDIIKGAIDAVNIKDGFDVVLLGDETIVNNELNKYTFDKNRVSVVHAPEVITCEEEPTIAIKTKPNSSLCVAFKILKEDESATALVSAGSTGAVLVGATLKVGRIPGVSRPALCPMLPTIDGGNVLMLDVGANADCKANNLVDFALLGNEYAKIMLGVDKPRVALLSNGTEDKKGNALTHEVFPLLKDLKEINFVGNMEARDILSGKVDVVVTDGFSGNVAIKSIEGAAGMVMKMLKREIKTGLKAKIGALLLKKRLYKMRDMMDYERGGGAVFVGCKKLIIKAHGSSQAITITNSILQAVRLADSGVTETLSRCFAEKSQKDAI